MYTIALSSKPKLLVIAQPFPISGGGGLRAMRSLEAYSERFDVALLYNSSDPSLVNLKTLMLLAQRGVKIVGSFHMLRAFREFDRVLGVSFFAEVGPKLIPPMIRTRFPVRLFEGSAPLVMSLHECFEELYVAKRLSDVLEGKSVALLQLPPFYGSRNRYEKILAAFRLWHKALFGNSLKRYGGLMKYMMIEKLNNIKVSSLLREFDLILAVSRTIPFEMGCEWVDRIRALDPGVTLNQEDFIYIKKIKEVQREKSKYIIFGGRPDASKGLIEGLLTFKSIAKHYTDLKFIVTGSISEVLKARLKKFCKKIKLENKVSFKGYVPRLERFKLINKARLMLYPSHVDAFSYAVLESLFLGTPVVGYEIPALKMYFGRQSGVVLQEEGNIEALTAAALDVLKEKKDIEAPKIRNWEEIMNEEIAILKELMIDCHL